MYKNPGGCWWRRTNLPLQFGEVDVDVCGTCLLNMNDEENGSHNGDTRE